MVLSYAFKDTSAINLDEYLDYIDSNIDVYDQDSLASSAEHLHRLSLNRELFSPIISSLKDGDNDQLQIDNSYTDATFMLARPAAGKYFVRANVWKVPKERGGKLDHEEDLYSYETPHDHNFDFMTVGYFGPGYCTRTYEYDYDRADGYIGEPIDIAFVEETYLTRGKVMFYRKSRDIHTQKPPESLSVSINLMVSNGDRDRRQQFFFDTEKSTISGYSGGEIGDRVGVVELAQLLGEEAVDPLFDIVKSHYCPRTRAAALKSMLAIAPGERDRMRFMFGADQSVLVKRQLELS